MDHRTTGCFILYLAGVPVWGASASALPVVSACWCWRLGFGLKPGSIPIDVILIIMSVIAAIAAMQVAGGLDYMVFLAEKVLRSNPKYNHLSWHLW